jgi:hypothetical protein
MEIKVVSTLNNNEIDQLLELYKNEFWCNKRKREDVEKYQRILMFSSSRKTIRKSSFDLYAF